MTSGPSCVLALTREDGDDIQAWQEEINSIEALKAQRENEILINSLHGGDSHETAMRFVLFQILFKHDP